MLRRDFMQCISTGLGLLWLPLASVNQALAGSLRYDFANNRFDEQWTLITNGEPSEMSEQITLTLPEIAENGAVVPIGIHSRLPDLQQLYLLVEKNPTPLAAVFELSPSVTVEIHTRIKMAESSNVHLLAKHQQRWLHCQQWVQVTVGGCGTG